MAATVPLTYQWTAAGVDVVEQAFTRIDKAAERSAQKAVAEAAKAAKAKSAAAAKAAREAEQTAAKEAAAAAKTAAAQTTAANKAAAQQAKARERVFQIRAKYEAQEAKNAARAADQAAKAQERAMKHVADVRTRYFMQQQREEEKAARARDRSSSKGWSTFGGSVGSAFKGAATTAAALGLGTVGVAARQEFALKDEANRIAVMGRKPGEKIGDSNAIVSQLHATAIANPGTKSEDLAAGMKEFVSLTNDLPLAQKHLSTLATAMQSMGTDAAGTAKIMVALKQSFGITGVQEMRDAMASLEAQAKASGMPMEALEGHILNMAAAGKRFGFTGKEGAQQVGGLMSMARQGIGDPEKAEKAAAHFLEKLQEQGGKLAAMGVTTVSKDGKTMKPLSEIVSGLITKVGGNNMRLKGEELMKLLGAGERGGAGVIGAPLATYRKTFNETEGTESQKQKAATAAMTEELNKLMGTTATWDTTEENAAQMQQAAGAQLEAAWEAIRAKVSTDVVPALASLAPMVTGATNVMDPFVAAVGFAAAVIKETFQTLIDAGILKKHEETPLEKSQKAEKKLADFNEAHKGAWADEGEVDQRTKLEKEAADAKSKLYVSPKSLPGRGSDEDFAREYAMASGKEGSDYQTQKDIGLKLAKQIHANPEDTRAGVGLLDPDTNDAQKDVISGRKSQEISDQSARAFDANAAALKSHQDAIQAAADAAKRLADNLDQAGDAAGRSTPLSDRN